MANSGLALMRGQAVVGIVGASIHTVQEVYMEDEMEGLRQAPRQWSRLLAAAAATVAAVAPGATILGAAHSASTSGTANRTSQVQPTLAGDHMLVQALCIHNACADW